MSKNVKPIFDWANERGDANITNRISAKVIPVLVEAKIILTDSMIKEKPVITVPQNVYNAIKDNAENLLDTHYEEEK